MKGIIFNLVEEAVTAEHGAATWDALLTSAGLLGAYSSLGDYPDEELHRLVAAGSAALGLPPDDVTRWLGRAALVALADRYPVFFTPHTDTRSFLLTLNDVIHPEVRKLHRSANPPEFDFEVTDGGDLVIGYRSARGLCALADGMIQGAGTVYGEEVIVRHDACTAHGAPVCVLRCSFVPAVTLASGGPTA